VHKRRKNYECSVKVFNSSVEIRVEKQPAMMEIARRSRGLLLFAQVLVQTAAPRSGCEIKFPNGKLFCRKGKEGEI
jgi:hypothetical protein